jgi:hypothetical protein
MFSAVKGFALKAAQGLTFGAGGYPITRQRAEETQRRLREAAH